MPTAASWERTWTCWCWRTFCCSRTNNRTLTKWIPSGQGPVPVGLTPRTPEAVMKFILTILYGLLILPARLVLGLLGRDPLMLRDDRLHSYWIELSEPPTSRDYFSQGRTRSGPHAARGIARLVLPVYRTLAKWYAPRKITPNVGAGPSTPRPVVRDQGIADENYTLWLNPRRARRSTPSLTSASIPAWVTSTSPTPRKRCPSPTGVPAPSPSTPPASAASASIPRKNRPGFFVVALATPSRQDSSSQTSTASPSSWSAASPTSKLSTSPSKPPAPMTSS